MTREEIISKAEGFGVWYHPVELIPGYTTKSNMVGTTEPQWRAVRNVRSRLDYHDKTVLDLGSMDGMWAFEAEELGAKEIHATDIWQGNPVGEQRIHFSVLSRQSKVKIFRIDVHELRKHVALPSFDIIQCLGILYHVENPILALRQIRACVSPSGTMLLETAIWSGGGNKPCVRLNTDDGVYCDPTTFWVPNYSALTGMLSLCGFQEIAGTSKVTSQLPNTEASRICMLCQPKKVGI